MGTMSVDGITAAVLTPPLERAGWTLADFAQSLADQARGGYGAMGAGAPPGAAWWDFTTAYSITGRNPIDLEEPGADPFSSPSGRKRIQAGSGRLPLMAGGIRRDGDRLTLAIGAILIGPRSAKRRMVLMTPRRPTLALIGIDLPETALRGTIPGPLRELVSSPLLDHADLRVVRWRRVPAGEIQELDAGTREDALGAKLKTIRAVGIEVRP